MPYVTVFDISQKPFEWWWSAIGVVIFAVGIVLIKVVSRWPSQKHGKLIDAKLIGWVMVFFGPIWMVVVYNSTRSMWAELRSAYKTGQYSIVEGLAEDFQPMPYEGHRDECFRVKAEQFCYSDYASQGGFNQSASHGGPIREGLPVRIKYYEGQILSLEIRQDSVPSPTERTAYAKAQETKWHNSITTDPRMDHVNLGFSFACVVITLCWNLDWQHYIRYWNKRGPPFARAWTIGFRVFFLANFIGALIYLIRQIGAKSRTAADFRQAALNSLLWIGFFAIADLFVRWRLRIRKQSGDNSGQHQA